MNAYLVLAGFAMLLVIGVVLAINGSAEQAFEVSACNVPSAASSPGGFSTERDGNTLIVTTNVSVNCAERIPSGSYHIDGDVITLRYERTSCLEDECTRCSCSRELRYAIEGVNPNEYRFELEERIV